MTEKIFQRLLDLFPKENSKLLNSDNALIEAIRSGRISYEDGQFKGRFNSRISLHIKRLGGVWDKKQGSFKLKEAKLSIEIKAALQYQQAKLDQLIERLTGEIQNLDAEKIADEIDLTNEYEKQIFMFDDFVNKQIQGMAVSINLTDEQKRQIAQDYNQNLKLYIKKWTDENIIKLRDRVSDFTMTGVRYDNLAKEIQDTYGASKNKAKFWARQETNLLLTEIRKQKYTSAGFDRYVWKTVVGTPKSPVRPMHKALNNKIIYWDDPPIVDEKGNTAHAGSSYNCRCYPAPYIEGYHKE